MRRIGRAWPVLVGVVGVAVIQALAAQERTIRVNVDVVPIDAQVTRAGQPVRGLRPSDFEVVDNGVVQRVESAEADGRLDLVLLLDVSASVRGAAMRALLGSADGLLGQLKAGERAALLTFNSAVRLRATLTDDVESVRRELKAVLPASSTSLNDAIFCGLAIAHREVRTLVIVFSDGIDTSSWLSGTQVIEAAGRTGAVVCPVTVGSRSTDASGLGHADFLGALADKTGGRLIRTESMSKVRSAFLAVLTDYRSRYLITYSPTGVRRDDGWHQLTVRVKSSLAEVRARQGYFAEGER